MTTLKQLNALRSTAWQGMLLKNDQYTYWEKRWITAVQEIKNFRQNQTVRISRKAYMQIIELLCIIHRDGGHYIADHGFNKAVKDAQKRYYKNLIQYAHDNS